MATIAKHLGAVYLDSNTRTCQAKPAIGRAQVSGDTRLLERRKKRRRHRRFAQKLALFYLVIPLS